MGEIIKQNVAFSFHGSNSGSLFTQLSSELEVDSLHSSCQSVVRGCSQSAKAAPSAVGMKRTQIEKVTQNSCLLVYGLWAAG